MTLFVESRQSLGFFYRSKILLERFLLSEQVQKCKVATYNFGSVYGAAQIILKAIKNATGTSVIQLDTSCLCSNKRP